MRTLVTVKNIGAGRSMHTEAVLRNGAGQEGILDQRRPLRRQGYGTGRDQDRSRSSTRCGPDYVGDDYQLELAVGDTTLGESVTDKIKVKIAPAGNAPEPMTGNVDGRPRGRAPLREAAADGALVVGRAPKGIAFKATGRLGAFTRVELDSGHSAFMAATDLKSGGTAARRDRSPSGR